MNPIDYSIAIFAGMCIGVAGGYRKSPRAKSKLKVCNLRSFSKDTATGLCLPHFADRR
jgi:hypothetical protein